MYTDEVLEQKKKNLKKIIEREVFITDKKEASFTPNGTQNKWIFDFKRVLLRVEVLDLVADIFWGIFFSKGRFQIGCLETTGITLVTTFIIKRFQFDGVKTNGFFIRKSRKREGFMRMFEGCELTNDNVILVDDSMNTGKSFMRQIEALESQNKKVIAVFVITRFREASFYTYLKDKQIQIISLFELDDFKETLGVSNLKDENSKILLPFQIEWLFKAANPAYFLVNPKSAPALDKISIYFGDDNGYFWCLDKNTGGVLWKYKVFAGVFGLNKKGKHILSSPKISKGVIYFGAYDGNIYALDTKTGKKLWVNMDADWVGSSPAIAPDLSLLFIGLEFGLFKKRGGIGAFDLKTGNMKWSYSMPWYTHSSPVYSRKNKIVVCGSEEGVVYGFNALTGDVQWKFQVGGAVKASFALNQDERYVAFGSYDTYVYVLDIKNGNLVQRWETGNIIQSGAIFHGEFLYIGCGDKTIYCFNYKNGECMWSYRTGGRIFATPIIAQGNLYIGSNDGIFYEFNLINGAVTGMFQSIERIVNQAVFDQETNYFYLPTVANELYKLRYENPFIRTGDGNI